MLLTDMTTTRRTTRPLLIALLISTSPFLQGCTVALVGAGVGAGIGAAKYGSAKQKEAYGKYRTDMEKVNLDREKAGLKPTPILTYEEWSGGKK